LVRFTWSLRNARYGFAFVSADVTACRFPSLLGHQAGISIPALRPSDNLHRTAGSTQLLHRGSNSATTLILTALASYGIGSGLDRRLGQKDKADHAIARAAVLALCQLSVSSCAPCTNCFLIDSRKPWFPDQAGRLFDPGLAHVTSQIQLHSRFLNYTVRLTSSSPAHLSRSSRCNPARKRFLQRALAGILHAAD
jgi:hypothetical protein